eukprot:gene22005-29063_t
MLAHGRVTVPVVAERSSIKPRLVVCKASTSRRALLSGMGMIAGSSVANMAQADTFLKSVGVRNGLESKEEELFRLRQEQEGQALRDLNTRKQILELEASATQSGKLCVTPFGVDVVGITELIAIIGATVGGLAARQRKDEMERLNDQLRKINLSLRQQARAGTVYAPGG